MGACDTTLLLALLITSDAGEVEVSKAWVDELKILLVCRLYLGKRISKPSLDLYTKATSR